ncbi:uncharacterized protein FIESC28_10076 [Fusarium coffeatum]|uniref:Uncharacterized protein n=1 Tax=Fusarium coffeatum TaxID=231269 RepID=A0A366QXT6_9HYPO|nr:uncharacterized protein FIESC28_10076 [Fusarium coffeatum]RBR08896.1 hypothetical protein FIESC28_10076 [Fusarium coffeatum]
MHPAYTLYIGLEARVAEWKSDMYAAMNNAFALPADAQVQVDEKKPLIVEKRVEEGREGLKEWTEKK